MATEVKIKTVYEAWSAVMESVQAVGKTGRNKAQGFNFRGIDAVVNAAGPAMREHGVIVIPTVKEAHYRDIEVGQKRTIMREVTVKVRYSVIGPAGDVLTVEGEPEFGTVHGESMASDDKGTAKAMSVAYRIFLLQALTIPTDEPDPDEHSYERASRGASSGGETQTRIPAVPAKDAQDKVLTAAQGDTAIAGKAWRQADLGDRQHIPQNLLDDAVAEAKHLVAEAAPEQPELPDNGKKAADAARKAMQPKGEGS